MARKAAVSALIIAAEGCHMPMRESLPTIIPQLLNCFNDQHLEVREAACICIGQFAEYLQPEINHSYQQLLPPLFNMLGDASPNVQEKACYALYSFCENLEEKIIPYLKELLAKPVSYTHLTLPTKRIV
eukprot:TRINITY_DN15349_c0_g1_i3.p2 TRINITY_DN15349_c0_g1~~TRINITY_DN15349_c0_g1_i3.p2  ORF type:complete len:129 (-),score=41.44 TRINITY_DN15349_c0_g1_i3:147-533(-)